MNHGGTKEDQEMPAIPSLHCYPAKSFQADKIFFATKMRGRNPWGKGV